MNCCLNRILTEEVAVCFVNYVHSVQQKSIGLKFSKSRIGSDVRYSCHHNSSRFNFLHICAFVAFLCLPFIKINHTAYILTEDTTHLLNLKLKH